MKATTELVREHEAIKRMARVLDTVVRRVESGELVPRADLEFIAEFFAVFADKCHHGKEEDILFPALESLGIPREGGPIGVMLYEHTQGRGFVRALKENAPGCASGDPQAKADFVSAAKSYMTLIAQHIDKEDNVLFPMADQRLTAEKDSELAAAFTTLEKERIGEDVHERLHAGLEELEQKYIG